MSAERIAEVVADIRAGKVDKIGDMSDSLRALFLAAAQAPQPVVDCTAIFQAQRALKSIDLYGDNPSITPPWQDVIFGFVNNYKNTIVVHTHLNDWDGTSIEKDKWNTGNTDHEIDWSQVRWIAGSTVWIGGQSGDGRYMPTTGPCHILRHAIRGDGAPEDINWVEVVPLEHAPRPLRDGATGLWEATVVTLTASLNFLNCSNVDVAEPSRPRPERRRLARIGVQVQTIVVRPPGRRRAGSGAARPIDASETPLTSVRGHFARYGVEGRGKLFGKYTGKFWIPAHARGVGDGEPAVRNYRLHPKGRGVA